MNIIDFRKICFDKHNRAYFLRVQPDDLKDTLSQIFYVLSNLSWISNFDEDYIRESFQERAKATLADIYAKITTSSTDEVSSDAGEYVVSELAREAIVDKLGYLDIPLAELYNKKKSGNPGFDFHSQSLDNLTDSEVQRLSDTNIDMLVKTALDSLFEGEHLISLAKINADYDSKLHLYESLCDLYRYYLNGRTLSEGEESVLNTAIKILLWKIHCKTFKAICWYRYAYVARIPERRAFAKKYRAAKSQNERQRIRAAAVALPAKFIRGYDDIPNKSLPNYSIYKRGTKATDVDYDRIVFDTYDYLDKLISFKLSDIFYAIFSEYYKRTNDIRALKMAQYFKYGTDNENEIWMLRYGLSFEDIEILKPYIVSIGQEEIVFSADIQNLSPEQIKPVERYL